MGGDEVGRGGEVMVLRAGLAFDINVLVYARL